MFSWRAMLFGGVVLAAGVGMVAARDSIILNWTASVPVGLYFASSSESATFVTFCLPPLPETIRHAPELCTWSQPRGRPVLKRLAATTRRGLHLCGDTFNALDSRLFGPLPVELARGYWRPVLTFDYALTRIGQRSPGCFRSIFTTACASVAVATSSGVLRRIW